MIIHLCRTRRAARFELYPSDNFLENGIKRLVVNQYFLNKGLRIVKKFNSELPNARVERFAHIEDIYQLREGHSETIERVDEQSTSFRTEFTESVPIFWV